MFLTPTPREGTHQKKLDVKTFLFSSSNRETQRCNGRKSRLSKLLSLVQKQLQKYNIRDSKENIKTTGWKKSKMAIYTIWCLRGGAILLFFHLFSVYFSALVASITPHSTADA